MFGLKLLSCMFVLLSEVDTMAVEDVDLGAYR